MSADPFANTTTVKNILNHIISPKIVKDGSGGYTTKTDLVNIDNLVFSSKGSGSGTSTVPLTSQCGVAVIIPGGNSVYVFHSRVTTTSIILATNKTLETNNSRIVSYVTPDPTGFTITLTGSTNANGVNTEVSWFIASF
jgi:hypothetical protein